MHNHQVTVVSFTGSGIHENGIDADVGTFIADLLNQRDPADTPVMKAFRTDQSSDFTFSTFLAWIDRVFNLTGEAGPISGHRACRWAHPLRTGSFIHRPDAAAFPRSIDRTPNRASART